MTKYYSGLVVTVILSFLALFQFNINASQTLIAPWIPIYISIDLPGIFFNSFVLVCLWQQINFMKGLILFVLLCFTYFLAFYFGVISWAMAVPIIGGVGGLLISFSIRLTTKKRASHGTFIGIGILATLPGWVLFYILLQNHHDGIGSGVIVCIWQLAIGHLIIKQIHKSNHAKDQKPNFNAELEQ